MEACFFILHQDRKNVSLNAYHGFEAPADQAGQRLVSFFLHIKNFYVLAAVQQCLRQFVGKKIQNMETYVGTPIDQDRERIVINRIIFRPMGNHCFKPCGCIHGCRKLRCLLEEGFHNRVEKTGEKKLLLVSAGNIAVGAVRFPG